MLRHQQRHKARSLTHVTVWFQSKTVTTNHSMTTLWPVTNMLAVFDNLCLFFIYYFKTEIDLKLPHFQ